MVDIECIFIVLTIIFWLNELLEPAGKDYTTVRYVPGAFVPIINIEVNNNTAPTVFENRMF